MKKLFGLILLLSALFISVAVYADFADISESDVYKDAIVRLDTLNIMDSTDPNEFDPQALVTRGEFCEIIVKAAGLQDAAERMKGSTVYSDVSPDNNVSGYINMAVNKGYMSEYLDENFHPDENVTFAQVCTAVVKALGYSSNNVEGLYPNYIEKASKLNLIDGIDYKFDDSVPKWVVVLIVDKLLDTDVKKSSASELDRSFAEAAGLYTKCIILANSATSDKLAENQILTDKGIYYINDNNLNLELGNTYGLDIGDNDIINAAYSMKMSLESYSIEGTAGTKISYKNDNGELTYKTFPDKTVYYYNGTEIKYENIKDILQTRSSVVFAYNRDKAGYEYAVIYDPVYSDPQVAHRFDPSSRQIGNISIPSDSIVIRDGKVSDIMEIRENDVVYNVTDVWNKYSYILAVCDKVGGKVNDVFPDRVTPKYLQVDGKDYYFSNDIDISKLSVKPGILEEDDNIVMLLGYDGKVVDLVYPGFDDNSNYAVVINTSYKIYGTSTGHVEFQYSAKLLTADGITATYFCANDPTKFKGSLVKFKWKDSKNISIEFLPYNYPKGVTVNKPERGINDSYASDNIRIFNVISNEDDVDAEVDLLDFQDLPQGTLADNKVFYLGKSGYFDDVNIMLTNDLLGEQYKIAVIESKKVWNDNKSYHYSYKLFVDGKVYTYEDIIASGEVGKIVKVKIAQGKIIAVDNVKEPDYQYSTVEAFDSKRIKINGRTFWLNKNISVYFWDYDKNVQVKSLADIDIDDLYGSVSLFLNKPADQGGKVEVILIRQ